jgi:hypothetical protein
MQTLHLTNLRTALAVVLLATVAGWLCLVSGASAAGGGNAINAKLCQQGGWAKLMDSSAHSFANQDVSTRAVRASCLAPSPTRR